MIDLIDGVKYRKICSLVCLFWVFVSVSAWALEDAEIPVDAPQDAIMASAEEVQAMLRWASAAFCEGLEVRGGEERPSFMTAAMPFSFVYDGVSSAELLKDWRHSVETKETPGRVVHTAAWTDPKTGLRITAVVTVFTRYAAADWLLFFENTGAQDTPIIENVQALDVRLRTGYGRKQVVLHRLTGDVCGEQSFLPLETVVEVDKPVEFAPTGGRPSNGAFPFFHVRYGEEGVFTAIGWSGQWAARLNRESAGPVRLQAGWKGCISSCTGERVRIASWLCRGRGNGGGHNRFRRLLLSNMRAAQRASAAAALGAQCFDRYSRTVPEWATEAGQLRAVRRTTLGATRTGSMRWFEGGFPMVWATGSVNREVFRTG